MKMVKTAVFNHPMCPNSPQFTVQFRVRNSRKLIIFFFVVELLKRSEWTSITYFVIKKGSLVYC